MHKQSDSSGRIIIFEGGGRAVCMSHVSVTACLPRQEGGLRVRSIIDSMYPLSGGVLGALPPLQLIIMRCESSAYPAIQALLGLRLLDLLMSEEGTAQDVA